LITGGTSGLGAAAAQQIASLGGTVVIAGRNARRCARQVEKIKRNIPKARLDFLVADLSSQQQIRHLAGEFAARYPRLDVLVNNAGAYFGKREISVDGFEMTFALNHLSYFLLTNLLLDRLKASASGRIVVVSSDAHKGSTINFDDLHSEHHYDRLSAYAQSKLANLLFTYALVRRLDGTRITVNALHPGSVATNIGSNANWLKTKLRNLLARGMISPDEGAKTITYLATSPSVEGITGRYFYEGREVRSSENSYVAASAEQLWRVSEMLVGPRIRVVDT
jgi:NAD(P)-dependent dehydrogenase (short-subunit alcohol dehydrogenase family)